jgi:hypothetical protein
MQNTPPDFTTGDFKITIERAGRLAFMRLDRNTAAMTPTELSALSKRLASTRRALAAAGYQVRYVDPPRRDTPGRKAG